MRGAWLLGVLLMVLVPLGCAEEPLSEKEERRDDPLKLAGQPQTEVFKAKEAPAPTRVFKEDLVKLKSGQKAVQSAEVWRVECDQLSAFFGEVKNAGDVNGDGFDDLIVGASQYDASYTNNGRVFLYLGSASGPGAAPAWTANGGRSNAEMGTSVSGAGDVNGDGYADVIVGTPGYRSHSLHSKEGQASLYLGSPSGLEASPSWTYESNDDYSYLGTSVSGAGDVNGDGYADVIVGAPGAFVAGVGDDAGRAYVFLGSASGLGAAPAWSLSGTSSDQELGAVVAGAGDLNGDGFADVAVAAPARLQVFLGSASGPDQHAEMHLLHPELSDVVGVGDVTGDGFGDLLVGAAGFDHLVGGEGALYLYYGSENLSSMWPFWGVAGNPGDALGGAVGAAGDVNGDGLADFVAGATGYDSYLGGAHVFLGGNGDPATEAAWTGSSTRAGSYYGISVSGVGDMDGDGLSEIVVGSRYMPTASGDGAAMIYRGETSAYGDLVWRVTRGSSNMGEHLGGAGDINGDGFDDLVVGIPAGTPNGEVQLYLGQPDGLEATPSAVYTGSSWIYGEYVTGVGDVNGDGYEDVVIGPYARLKLGSPTGLQDSSWYGEYTEGWEPIAGVGDVNGDGFDDVVVADEGDAGGTGQVFLYFGSESGLSSNPVWIYSSPQNGTFGRLLSGGDFNGDGYSDALIGDPYYDRKGGAFVFSGGPAGLSANPTWTHIPDDRDTYPKAMSAGDLNGDGYDDIVVSEPGYELSSGSGRVLVIYGSASGLGAPVVVEESGGESHFGRSIRGAGDVNGDGFADVLFNPMGEGEWWLYLGSEAGLSSKVIFNTGSPAYDFGIGDYNGDGFSDVVFGESYQDRVSLYLGNSGDAALATQPLRPQARQAGADTPIPPWGFSLRPDAVDFSAYAYSPYGPTKAQLEVEIKPTGVPFDGLDLSRSEVWIDGVDQNGRLIQHSLLGLTAEQAYHWRLRLVYDPSQGFPQRHSHWLMGGEERQANGIHLRTPVNQAPVLGSSAPTEATEDLLYSYDAEGSDPDGGTLTWSLGTGHTCGGSVDPESGLFSFTPVGPVPPADCVLALQACDGQSPEECVTEQLNLTIVPVNDAPEALDDSGSVDEDQSVLLLVLDNDSDPEGDPLSIAGLTPPTSGAVVDHGDGTLTYTPFADFNGSDSFTYQLSDGALEDSATVHLSIAAVNDAPVLVAPTPAGPLSAQEGQLLGFEIAATDVDGDLLSYGVLEVVSGLGVDSESGQVSWTPTWAQAGQWNLSLVASDGALEATQVIVVEVTAIDDDGDGVPDGLEEVLGLDPQANDSDGDTIPDAVELGDDLGAPLDSDEDGVIDALDEDSDDDGLLDLDEAGDDDLSTPPIDTDEDEVPDYLDEDSDEDGVLDADDLCPLVADPEQVDTDGDGVGDACTDDADGDGVMDEDDLCPLVADPEQVDTDADGDGDACDQDDDDDGVLDEDDLCPLEHGLGEDGCPEEIVEDEDLAEVLDGEDISEDLGEDVEEDVALEGEDTSADLSTEDSTSGDLSDADTSTKPDLSEELGGDLQVDNGSADDCSCQVQRRQSPPALWLLFGGLFLWCSRRYRRGQGTGDRG